MTRIRFKGLRTSSALSAPERSPVVFRNGTSLPGPWRCDPGSMLLRMLREPASGGPSPLMRVVAVALLVGLVGMTAPVLIPLARWVLALL